jgi:FkbM family methyltransferase
VQPYNEIVLRLLKRILPPSTKRRAKLAMGFQDMETRLRNLARAGFRCTGAVDVGAFEGDWARLANDVFACPVLMCEPLPDKRDALRSLAGQRKGQFEAVALSTEAGTATFYSQETNSHLAHGHAREGVATVEVAKDRLDNVLRRHPEFRPNLLKVDVQGLELDVLRGAGERLADFEVIVMEVSIIPMGDARPFRESIEFMAQHGYELYDFLPMYYRPLDGALWQGDAFFVRRGSALIASRAYA